MSHILEGRATESEISNFIGDKPVVTAYEKDKDNPNAYSYDYWSSIKHPETGERLKAVKGYCNPDNLHQCYYAEYRDDAGNSYHYIDSRYYREPNMCGNKSISEQQSEDEAKLERKLDSQKHQDFFEQSQDDESKSSEKHQDFFENTKSPNESNHNASMSDESSKDKSNPNKNFNGQT